MWSKNLKSFFTHLANNKLYTLITVFGFAISLTFVILLSTYVKNELSVDRSQVNRDRIYRLITDGPYSGFAPPVGERLLTNYPEIESYTRMFQNSGVLDAGGEEKFRIDYLMADSAFFTMFSFPLLEGNPEQVLASRNGMVLSRSFSLKAFGPESPVGKEVTLDERNRFIVTGVMEDLPGNTHFQQCDAILNFRALADIWGWQELLTTYYNSSFGIYFLAKKGTDLPSKAPMILNEFRKDYWIYKEGRADTLMFEQLTDCYFSPSGSLGIKRNNKTLIMVYTLIVVLILVLAVINYINLTVSQAGFRGKEAAIRKILGSSKKLLIRQFMVESILICVVSFGLALVLSLMAEPVVDRLLGTSLGLKQEFNPVFFGASAAFLVLVGIVSGLAPALVIARFSPVEVVKGSFRRKSKSQYSKVLISFQYLIASCLVLCTWMIARQAFFLKDYDPGFHRENMIVVQNDIPNNRRDALRNEMESIAGVRRVAFVAGSPLDGGNNQSWVYDGKPVSFQELIVDSAFLDMMGFEITPTGAAYDKKGMYLNKTAVKVLELDSLPTSFRRYDTEVPVLGIVKDFNFRNLYDPVGPLMIGQMTKEEGAWSIFIKTDGYDNQGTLNRVRAAYEKFTGGIPMNFQFVDNRLHEWYRKEENTSKIIGYFSLLTLVIAVMGIFAMSSYFIQQRIKDIGIRKVNGARSFEIMSLLSRDFLRWVLLAFLAAAPVSWFVIRKWMQQFAYKTDFPWWIFPVAGLVEFAEYRFLSADQSWRAASRNPAESLRYE